MSKDIKIGQEVFVVDFWGQNSGKISKVTCTGQQLVDGHMKWYVDHRYDGYDESKWLDDAEIFTTAKQAQKAYLEFDVKVLEESLCELRKELKRVKNRIEEQEAELAQATATLAALEGSENA